ncbi:MAG: hypothetical protein HOI47_30025 [Candidatus Scalindua sp.]|nr:hypothetical protein [Candidatus Scalindua sp.]
MEIDEEIFPKCKNFHYSHVAFIDILGFDQKVKDIDNQKKFHEIAKLLYAARHAAETYNKKEGVLIDFRFTAISDSIIVSAPYKDYTCTLGLIHILQEVQYNFLASGFKTLIRGYLDRGKIYNRDGFLFGEGYNNAYKGEQQIGGSPRIVVSSEIIQDAEATLGRKTTREGYKSIFDFVKEDPCDGLYFIDYLKPIGYLASKERSKLLEDRHEIKRIITSNLIGYTTNQKIRSKYKWLETYFDHSEVYYKNSS